MGMRLPARWRAMTCRCGHSRPAHGHYSRRTSCAFCPACRSFTRDWRSWMTPRASGL